jgi:hypothetical protein
MPVNAVAASAAAMLVLDGLELAAGDDDVDQVDGDLPRCQAGDVTRPDRATSAFAAAPLRSLGAPAGINSISSWWPRFTAWVRDRTRSRRRDDSPATRPSDHRP